MKMNHYEYIKHLLDEEQQSSRILRRASQSGNDKFGRLFHVRLDEIAYIEKSLTYLNDEIAKTTDADLLKILNEIKNKLENKHSEMLDYGYDILKKRYNNRYPYLQDLHEYFKERFLIKYYDYRVGYNTLEQFSYSLYDLFEDIAPEYENKLRAIAMYKKQVVNDDGRIKDENLGDVAKSDNISSSYFFNEQDDTARHKSAESESGITTENTSLQTRIKNILSSYAVDQNVLRDYLNEYKVLFINVWSDETGVF